MIIDKQTIEYFKAKGIVVKYYPDATFDDFKNRVYDESVKYYFDYYKDHVRGANPNCNVLFETYDELSEKSKIHADINVLKHGQGLGSYDKDVLYVQYDHNGNHRTICKKISVKSKEITVEYVEKLIAKDIKAYNGHYGKFADAMNRVLESAGYGKSGFCVYPTTYGIGVFVSYNWNAEKNIADVEKILKANNVEYYNEYSDKMWVYRFKISKKQANIELAAAC